MPTSLAGTVRGLLVLNRFKILIVFTLALTWSVASFLPNYQDAIKSSISAQVAKTREKIPAVKIDFHPEKDPRTAYNSSKLAVLIEGRPIPHLVPQILHMIQVVPPDWRFLFIGSNESVLQVGRSFATKYQQASGKLDLMIAPPPFKVDSKEDVWQMLTSLNFYDELLPGVEWMLKFESDSIMCSNSGESLNDWLGYDWAGAPRTENDRFAGNGGLSLRRISAVRRVLSFQVRAPDSQAEDEWFGKRISLIPGLMVASGEQENHFSVEEVWHEKPMGYHVLTKNDGELPEAVWKSQENRMKIFEYCPEIAIIMPMKLQRERCDGDGDGEGGDEEKDKENADRKGKRSTVKRSSEEYVPAFRNEISSY